MNRYGITRPDQAVAAAVVQREFSPGVDWLDAHAASNRYEAWQSRAWVFYDSLGEIHYPASRIARTCTLIDWNIYLNHAEDPLDGNAKRDVLDTVTAGIGEDEATRRLALNLFMNGAAWYVEKDDALNVFSPTTPHVRKAIDESPFARLIYTPHPRLPHTADSSMRAALDPSEDLLLLTKLSRVQSKSRIVTAGVLLVQAGVEGMDDFYDDLVEGMTKAIADEDIATSFAPAVLRWPSKDDVFEHVPFTRDFDDKLDSRIEKAQRRIAIALDIPHELIEGIAELNHWSAWLVDADTWTSHIKPLVTQIAELYEVVAGEKLGGSYRFEPDPSEMLAKPAPIRDALDAYPMGVVSSKYLREQLGATEDDAPTDDDLILLAALGRRVARDETVAERPGPPVAAYGAAQVARDQARAKIGAKLRSKLGKNAPDVANEDIVSVIGLAAASKHLNLREEATLGTSVFDKWWTDHVGGQSPKLADHVLATLPIAAANLDAINLDNLADSLTDKDQELLRALAGKIAGDEDLDAVVAWWDGQVRDVWGSLTATGLDIAETDWMPGLMSSRDTLVLLAQQHRTDGTPNAETAARVVMTQAGGG